MSQEKQNLEMPQRVARITTATVRDLKVMKWIGTNGVASFKQLFIVFWPQAQERNCQERLLELEKAGWIERHFVDTSRKRGEQVYCLTKYGAREHFESGERRWLIVGLPPLCELKQQLTAQDTRIVLEQQLAAQGKQLIRWLNERQLKSEAYQLRKPSGSGRKIQGRLAGIPDGRIFVCNNRLTSTNDYVVAGCRGEENNQIKGNANEENNLSDEQDVRPGKGREGDDVQQIEIEIDGQYYGKMLKSKIAGLVRTKRPSLWVTGRNRAAHIEAEIKKAGASNIQVLVVDPLV